MGFFTDIIRDSQRGGIVARTSEASLSRGGKEVPTDAPAAAEGDSVAPHAATESDTSVIRLREEGGGQPSTVGQMPLQAGAVTRQVVGPSPSEHAPVAGIPEVTVKEAVFPNPVKREQAGCESARTVTGDFRVEQMESFHDGGSNDVPLVSVSASDSFVRESSSGYAASRTGKVSVETQGRRQAGVIRAGSTTPPEQFDGALAEAVTPEENAWIAPGMVTDPRVSGAPEEPPYLHGAERSKPHPSGDDVIPPADDAPRGVAESPVHSVPAQASQSDKRFERADRGVGIPQRAALPPEPRVQIGTIEVVVVVPEQQAQPRPSDSLPRADLASRHYLRNL